LDRQSIGNFDVASADFDGKGYEPIPFRPNPQPSLTFVSPCSTWNMVGPRLWGSFMHEPQPRCQPTPNMTQLPEFPDNLVKEVVEHQSSLAANCVRLVGNASRKRHRGPAHHS
jgi:hypothetical protein